MTRMTMTTTTMMMMTTITMTMTTLTMMKIMTTTMTTMTMTWWRWPRRRWWRWWWWKTLWWCFLIENMSLVRNILLRLVFCAVEREPNEKSIFSLLRIPIVTVVGVGIVSASMIIGYCEVSLSMFLLDSVRYNMNLDKYATFLNYPRKTAAKYDIWWQRRWWRRRWRCLRR